MNLTRSHLIEIIIFDLIQQRKKEDIKISSRTINRLLGKGLTRDQVVALYKVSSEFKKVCVSKGKCTPKFIPVESLEEYAQTFLGPYFTHEGLQDSVQTLVDLVGYRLELEQEVHISDVIRMINKNSGDSKPVSLTVDDAESNDYFEQILLDLWSENTEIPVCQMGCHDACECLSVEPDIDWDKDFRVTDDEMD